MYLGYDENGNIITKDPSGERGEAIRPLLGVNQMTQEEYLGALKKAKKSKAKAMRNLARKQELAMQNAFDQVAKRNHALKQAEKSAEYLRKMKYARSTKMYSGLGGVMGNGLTPHHVSGEDLANTFRSDYGLSGADFGFGHMGAYTPEFVKSAVKSVYERMLKIEKVLKRQSDALGKLKDEGKTNTQAYSNLKSAYDKLYKEYQNTPVKLSGFSWASRRSMFIDFGMKLKSLIDKINPEAGRNMALMFGAPLVYEQQVKSGTIKASFSGYGFGSEFTRGEQTMGILPLLAIGGWQAIAAAFAGGSLLYVVYNYIKNPIPDIDKTIASSDKLIEDALKSGQYEVAQKLAEQRGEQIKQKTEAIESSGITGQLKSATQNIAKVATILGVGFLLFKYGLPMLQSRMGQKTQAGV